MDEKQNIKVHFFSGYTPEAYLILEELIDSRVNLVGVTFQDKGYQTYSLKRKLKNFLTSFSTQEPKSLLTKSGIPFCFYKDLSSKASEDFLLKSSPDVLLLYGTSIIKKNILDIPKIGVLNSHSALLPKYRGGKSEFWILKNNEPKYAGVTIHWVTPGLDEGDIFLQEGLDVSKNDTPLSLRLKSVPKTAKLFVKALEMISVGNIVRIPQNESEATKYKRPTKDEEDSYYKNINK